jgi:phage shock protein A
MDETTKNNAVKVAQYMLASMSHPDWGRICPSVLESIAAIAPSSWTPTVVEVAKSLGESVEKCLIECRVESLEKLFDHEDVNEKYKSVARMAFERDRMREKLQVCRDELGNAKNYSDYLKRDFAKEKQNLIALLKTEQTLVSSLTEDRDSMAVQLRQSRAEVESLRNKAILSSTFYAVDLHCGNCGTLSRESISPGNQYAPCQKCGAARAVVNVRGMVREMFNKKKELLNDNASKDARIKSLESTSRKLNETIATLSASNSALRDEVASLRGTVLACDGSMENGKRFMFCRKCEIISTVAHGENPCPCYSCGGQREGVNPVIVINELLQDRAEFRADLAVCREQRDGLKSRIDGALQRLAEWINPQ